MCCKIATSPRRMRHRIRIPNVNWKENNKQEMQMWSKEVTFTIKVYSQNTVTVGLCVGQRCGTFVFLSVLITKTMRMHLATYIRKGVANAPFIRRSLIS